VTENAKSTSTVRERIARAAEESSEQLQRFFEDALAADRKIWTSCPTCSKRHEVEIHDWNARTKVVEVMLNQGFGRPKSEDATGGQGFILKRVIVTPDGTEVDHDAYQRFLAWEEAQAAPFGDSDVAVV
jgi:hypothetical protein